MSTTGGVLENNWWNCSFLPATAKPAVFRRYRVDMTEIESRKPLGVLWKWSEFMKKNEKDTENLRVRSLSLTCWISYNIVWPGNVPGHVTALIFLYAQCTFTCSLPLPRLSLGSILSYSFIPPSHAHLSPASLFPLPQHTNTSQGQGFLFAVGVIICNVCKLSGHDKLAALNRPLLTDTDGTGTNHHWTTWDKSKRVNRWEGDEEINWTWELSRGETDTVCYYRGSNSAITARIFPIGDTVIAQLSVLE